MTANADTTVTIGHNLGVLPRITQVFCSNNANPDIDVDFIGQDFHLNNNWGYQMRHKSKDVLKVFIGHYGLYHPGSNYFGGGSGGDNLAEFANGWIKVMMWK